MSGKIKSKESSRIIEKDVMKFKVILTEDEDGGYNIVCPALKGCRSQGDTIEETLENIEDAIKLYLQTANELSKRYKINQLVKEVRIAV